MYIHTAEGVGREGGKGPPEATKNGNAGVEGCIRETRSVYRNSENECHQINVSIAVTPRDKASAPISK